MSPLLAQSGHRLVHRTCPLSGVKQTCLFALHMSAYDPKRTLAKNERLIDLPQGFSVNRNPSCKVPKCRRCAFALSSDPSPGDRMKKVLPAPRLLLVLALVGLAVAYYDAYILYNGQQLWCPPPINGCNEVASSPYARIFNLPVGYFGVVYYLYMLCLAALLAYDPFSRGLRLAALIYSAIGVGFSIYFTYLQVTFIHAFCIYCLVSAITTLLLFIAAISHFRATRTLE